MLSVAWTLTIAVLFYAAVPLLALAVRRAGPVTAERLAALVLAAWLASIAFTVAADLQGAIRTGLWLRGSFPAMWQMFCSGILLAIAPRLRAPSWRRWLIDFPASGWALPAAAALLAAAALIYSLAPLRFGLETYQLVADSARPLFAVGYGIVLALAIGAQPWFQR